MFCFCSVILFSRSFPWFERQLARRQQRKRGPKRGAAKGELDENFLFSWPRRSHELTEADRNWLLRDAIFGQVRDSRNFIVLRHTRWRLKWLSGSLLFVPHLWWHCLQEKPAPSSTSCIHSVDVRWLAGVT
jgi:hypothetical protein